ncbi:MAG: hypothetical protein HY769_05000 [Candidatus Stahlbacteria bacterium]|nr:hypothetical protein [Candidatus Stahlbacteria bacterium]
MRRNINIKRVLIAGIVANLMSFIVGGGGYLLFGWVFQLEPQNIWKWTPGTTISMSLNWWIFLILGNTVLAIALALVYAILFNGIPGQGVKKGMTFGFLVWIVGVLPAMFSMYVLVKIATGALFYFATQGLLEYLIYGAVISLIYKGKV